LNPVNAASNADQNAEVAALIETLHATGQRLEDLTHGEVDTVTDRRGRTLMLQRAQDHLRQSESAKQVAILDALPACIALLDAQGCIASANQAWRQVAAANLRPAPNRSPPAFARCWLAPPQASRLNISVFRQNSLAGFS